MEESSMKLFDNDKGIEPEFLEQLKTYSGKNRDPREYVATVAYYALVKKINMLLKVAMMQLKPGGSQWTRSQNSNSRLIMPR